MLRFAHKTRFHRTQSLPSGRRQEGGLVRYHYEMLITPEVAFQQAANRAADVYAQAPAYVTYQVTTHAVAPSLKQERTVARAVAVRTRDDLAVLAGSAAGAQHPGAVVPHVADV